MSLLSTSYNIFSYRKVLLWLFLVTEFNCVFFQTKVEYCFQLNDYNRKPISKQDRKAVRSNIAGTKVHLADRSWHSVPMGLCRDFIFCPSPGPFLNISTLRTRDSGVILISYNVAYTTIHCWTYVQKLFGIPVSSVFPQRCYYKCCFSCSTYADYAD